MSEIISKLKKIINKDNPIILEIGCWNGHDTKIFLNHFSKCRIYGFEPDPRNIDLIKRSIKDDRFELIEEAISDKDEYITFYESHGIANGQNDWSASGSINKPKEHLKLNPHIKFGNGIQVFGRKLDTFIENKKIKNIDLIWADVNGAEYKLILGAERTLKITKYFYTEFSPLEKEIYEGGITKNLILTMLPYFEEVFEYKNNVLLKNKNINE